MLSSDSITLRAVEPSDADFMYAIENDTVCWRYGENVAPLSRKILREYALTYDANPFSAGQLRLIITETGTGIQVGVIDLYEISRMHGRAFIGIYIMPDFREKGYAEEALRLLERYSVKVLRLRMLAARIESSNLPSLALFEARHFNCVAVIPDWFISDEGELSSLHVYTKYLKKDNNPS